MEENIQMVDIIPAETTVSIEINTAFYKRMQDIFHFLTKDKSTEDITKAFSQIKEQKITEDLVAHIETILIFCNTFEQEVKNKKLFKSLPIDEAKKALGI